MKSAKRRKNNKQETRYTGGREIKRSAASSRNNTPIGTEISAATLAVLVVIGAVLIGVVSALGEIGNAWVDAFNLTNVAAFKVWIFLAIVAIVGGFVASLLGSRDLRKH